MSEKFEQGPKFDRNVRFRQLVEGLVKQSDTFEMWTDPEDPDEKVNVLDVIEKNELSMLAGKPMSDEELDAVECLTAIYDELGKEKPDEGFIEETVELLKEYLPKKEIE